MRQQSLHKIAFPAVAAVTLITLSSLPGCIKNDLPYPKIEQRILSIAVEGESKSAYIDSVTQQVTLYLEETTDIQRVKFTEFSVSEGGVAKPDPLDSVCNLSTPMFVDITRFQTYTWEIRAVQDIERYFEVDGEIGSSIVDPVGHRVVVHVPEGTDLSDLTLLRCKLGPAGITTITPALNPGPLDLSYPLRVEVTAWGRTTIWTIYAEIVESIVSTTRVDAWSKVAWCYGAGPADVANGFEYRKAGDSDWTPVPQSAMIQTQGQFSCCIPHLDTLTEYEVRAVSGENKGNVVKVKTETTELIPDGDFDQWSKTAAGMWNPWAEGGERFWDTGNTGTFTLKMNNTYPCDDLPPGITAGKSVEMITRTVALFGIGKLGAGSIFTGIFKKVDGTNGILDFGRPWKLRPTRLKGYFKYDPQPIASMKDENFKHMVGQPDTCQIYVALTDWTAPYEIRTNPSKRNLFDKNASYIIAYGELVCGSKTGWKPFTIELNYRDTSKVPTYLQITATGSKYGDYFVGGEGTMFWVDQFSFDWDY